MSIAQKEKIIIEEFASIEEWFDKYEKIIEVGKSAVPMPAEYKIKENEINGCQAIVWIYIEEDNNRLKIWGDSDAMITKGILSLILRVLNNEPKEEIASATLPFLDAIGLRDLLSPSRANGLFSILKRIQQVSKT